LFEHLRDLVFHAQPGAFEVDRDRAVEVFFAALGGCRLHSLRPGVVEGIVNAPEALDRVVHHALDVR